MSQIDFSRVITAEDKAAEAAAARASRIKAECGRRIFAIADETTQANIVQAGVVFSATLLEGATRAEALAAAGLREGDLTRAAEWRTWVAAMVDACRAAIDTGAEPVWPEVPPGAAELAARF